MLQMLPHIYISGLFLTGTSVMRIIATDADEEGNENSQIAFSIVDQKPAGEMFYISNDGTIYVKNALDREVRNGLKHIHSSTHAGQGSRRFHINYHAVRCPQSDSVKQGAANEHS